MNALAAQACAIFDAALAGCGAQLLVRRATASLSFPRLRLVAIGKAALDMAIGMGGSGCEIVAGILISATDYLSAGGAVGEAALERVSLPGRWHVALGEHPIPGRESFAAAVELRAFLAAAGHDAVLFLLSGGGSSIVEMPLSPWFHNRDIIEWNRIAAASAYPITSINVVRKHMSALKGGRLLGWLPDPARAESWILSDVPAGRPDLVASGPTLSDPSTKEDCAAWLSFISAAHPVTAGWAATMRSADFPETPKPSRSPEGRSHPVRVLADNRLLVATAGEAARQAGFEVTDLGSDWEAEDRELYMNRWQRWLAARVRRPGRAAAVGGGELATERLGSGIGGRNLDFSLRLFGLIPEGISAFALLTAASDGHDGSAPAAGALLTEAHLPRWRAAREAVTQALEVTSDTYPLLQDWDAVLPQRVTGNNLRDLHVLLVDQ